MVRRRLVLGLYVFVLTASGGVRWLSPAAPPAPDTHVVHVAGSPSRPPLSIAYSESGVPGPAELPVVIVHGSPGDRRELEPLGRALGPRRVLVPDLPGFGDSTRRVPDYGFTAASDAVLGALDGLGIRRVHLVGFSMGGGVVLTLAGAHPERVASLALVSAIGVQEMELFGDYELNHAAHRAQWTALLALREGIPHFGWLDGRAFGVEYARSFVDADQRPLRRVLEGLPMPVEIIHGRDDTLVPVAAAREHARLVPHSELMILDGDHFLVNRAPAEVAARLAPFLARVEAGLAPSRVDAPPSRVLASLAPFDPSSVPPLGPVAQAVLLLVLALGTLVSEDLTCVAAGALVARGRIGLLAAASGCAGGIFIGDLALFCVGRWCGRMALARWPLTRLVTSAQVDRASKWLAARGTYVLVASRFVPGTRLPTYLAAGALGVGPLRFALVLGLAALVWTPLLVGFAATATRLGVNVAPQPGIAVTAAASAGLTGGIRLCVLAFTHEGRRRLAAAWLRCTRWEFWPSWALYAPLLPWFVYLGLKYRHLTAFTAANPGMPAAGFIGESKIDILSALERGGASVAPFITIDPALPPEERRSAARAFATRHALPLVLKPDQGQRGTGVEILRSPGALAAAVSRVERAHLLQAYVAGPEFGLFYARRPGETHGRLLSITAKVLPAVVGDGRRTLDQLIMDDGRAVALLGAYRATNQARLDSVPAPGERVVIGALGSHCRGAIFEDGHALNTPALADAVEAHARAMPGFAFGRFDVRAPSAAALRAGQFTVLELNGVTAEPTEIYDAARSVWSAWRTLAASWALAFEIGRAHADAGARTWSVRALLRLVRTAWRAQAERPALSGLSFDRSPAVTRRIGETLAARVHPSGAHGTGGDMRSQQLIGTVHGSLLAAVIVALGVTIWAAPQPPRSLGRDGVALGGYDAVAYFVDSKAIKGDPRFEYTWDGARWRFASSEHRDRFAANPQQFAPQYGGYCAYAVSQGHTATADPEMWSVVDGKLYVNYSASVRATWEKDVPGYIAKANANWPGVLGK